LLLFTILIIGRPSSLLAVKKDHSQSKPVYSQSNKDLPKIPEAMVLMFEKRAKNAIVFSAIGVGMVIGVITILSLGTMTGALPVLALGGLFANIGFIKAMRLRRQTKSRKRTFFKARERSKIAIILSCVLGITLVFGLLSLLLNQSSSF